jgi:hypothetical protein
LLWHAVKDYSG